MPPDSTGLTNDFVESVKTTVTVSPAKPLPIVLGPLSMRDAYCGEKTDRNLVQTISSISKKSQMGNLFKLEVDDIKPCKDETLSGFVGSCDEMGSGFLDGDVDNSKFGVRGSLHFGSLTLKPDNIARIVPGRITVVRFLPCSDLRMVVVGNKFGNISFWNLDSKKEEDGDAAAAGIFLYRPHSGPISGILAQQYSLSKIFTSCYDGFIRLMDVEKNVFDLVYSTDDAIFSLFQRPDNVQSLYFGEGYGGFKIWDVRAGKSSSERVLHEHRINSIDFNSQNPNIMATSSTDGSACLWDLRSMAADKPKALKIVNHKRAVHSAYFSPSGSSLATTSFDNTVGAVSGANFEDTTMIFHDNRTGRWISSFRAIWGWDDSNIIIGNMKRGVDVISPALRSTIMTLQSPHMSAIPCRFHAHPYEVGMLAGATSGGQVYVWTRS
ncbi:WD40 domain-containing protein [Cephalotus follicularis]|uniref:WD repeat-containing protein 76 n=1 Tax=Cephalotus follicularis TaxID=3775 RepID=A0A1Q3CUL8_CEPFO|nr:WD40 domain-containing protein [Cephalotus follicularis]